MAALSASSPPSALGLIKGVGPKRSQALARLGIASMEDLLRHFPRDWQDRSAVDSSAAFSGGLVVLRGVVVESFLVSAGPRLAIFKAVVDTGAGRVGASWFKRQSRRYDAFAALKKDVVPGAAIFIVGKAEPSLAGINDVQAEEHYLVSDPRRTVHVDRLTPIYALTEGLSQRWMRETIHQALESGVGADGDALPERILLRRGLLRASQALRGIHYPASKAELEAARTRLAYEELLLLELAWSLKRRQSKEASKGFGYDITRRLLTPFKERLRFELTGAQKRVIREIFADMRAPCPMTRLLQGDVGSGKTVVALSALLLAVENGFQGAFMAPTEILAEQHKATLDGFLKDIPVKTAVLTSRVSAAARAKIISAAAEGKIDILVGTHSLLEQDVRFAGLKLAVIDEQHRFGVRQRATLRQKSEAMDMLIMTATPIPRTLALALFGDLDVSTIDEMPPGRTKAQTRVASEDEAFAAARDAVSAGRQAYVVYPIIEESSRLDLRSAKAEFERLRDDVFPEFKVALIHGAMPGRQKSKIMEEFSAGIWQILVATPVIEVGIDVPNAVIMIIQNADRFGLASLHQLRGRIGRGAAASFCFLVADPKTPRAKSRLDIVAGTHDGFRIGEEDLRLRGPGELLGTAQHGEIALRIADISKDAALLALAREDAEEVLGGDPTLSRAENRGLRREILSRYQKSWSGIDLS
ncbi:MAG: ATP-dependent DNA helicase RecG [Elusimicrobiota bacterium]